MIGKKVSEMCLDGAQLQFYQYNGDLKELLEGVSTKPRCSGGVHMLNTSQLPAWRSG